MILKLRFLPLLNLHVCGNLVRAEIPRLSVVALSVGAACGLMLLSSACGTTSSRHSTSGFRGATAGEDEVRSADLSTSVSRGLSRQLSSVHSVVVAPVEFSEKVSSDLRGQISESLGESVSRGFSGEVFDFGGSKGKPWEPGILNNTQKKAVWSEVARKSADAALFTTVDAAKERKGSRVGALQPVTFVFRMELVSASSGKPLWGAHYSFRDQPLSSNLFAAGASKRPYWQSLANVVSRAFSSAVSDFNQQRLRGLSSPAQ